MIDILEELHQKYLPVKKINPDEGDETTEVQERIFFGGDQFTEERARCCTDARSDGDTPYERLEGYISKVEDWHAIRILYQVCLKICILRLTKKNNKLCISMTIFLLPVH